MLLDTPCRAEALALLKKQFHADLSALDKEEEVSLLGKWLPSVNASNEKTVLMAKQIAKAFGLSERDYRKALVRLRARIRILENNLRERDYTFDYAKQPSKAMFKYRKAFLRNDRDRYLARRSSAYLARASFTRYFWHLGLPEKVRPGRKILTLH